MNNLEDFGDFPNASQRSNLRDINHDFENEDNNSLNASQNYDEEPLNDFEKIITENLNYINSNNGLLRHITTNDIKNKKIENIKHLVKWIKSEHNWVNENLNNKVTKCADDLAESNTKLADAVSRFEMKVTNNETKIEKVSKSIESKLKSEFGQKFNEIDYKFSNALRQIAEDVNNCKSSIQLLDNRVLVLESNYNAFVGDFNQKLATFEIKFKSDTDIKNTKFEENINQVKQRLETLNEEMYQLKTGLDQDFSVNKDFVESLSEGLKLCNSQLSELRTNCQQNDIDRKMEIKSCFKKETENLKLLSENFSKELMNMRDSMEFKQNQILDKANGALVLAKRNENEVAELKANNLSFEECILKLNGSLVNLALVQKDSNDVLTVLSENAKKVKQNLNDLHIKQKEVEDNIKDVSEKQKVVEKNLSHIDVLSQSCKTSIDEINKWMGEKDVWIKNSDKNYDVLKRDNSTILDRIINENKKLKGTCKDIMNTFDKETSNLKNKISNVNRDVKSQASNFLQLATDVKHNFRETVRAANEYKLLETQQHDLKNRTSVIEGSKNKESRNPLSTIARLIPGVPPGVTDLMDALN